ncbi:MAG: hypothetical protein MUF47_04930 [Porphyrobacter sp.]|jgi:hypothetical protein|nr:hypothetical protein [Porphyrobacter sp.]
MTLRNAIALSKLASGSDPARAAIVLIGGCTALSAVEAKILQDLPRAA